MPVLNPKFADLFCGAGGMSEGAMEAFRRLGLVPGFHCGVNHNAPAIETHSAAFPDAIHYLQDIATVRPSAAVPGGALDLLLAAPTCTHHSRARGGRPTSDQFRMDPWHIIPWLTEVRTTRFCIENVPEFVDWGPVDPISGKPDKSRRGEYFRSWWSAIQGLGFKVDHRVRCAADFGDATTRERLLMIGRSDGRPLRWAEPTHAADPTRELFGSTRLPWRPAREIIDWSIPGRSIFNRKHPLAPATLRRIYAGAVKFGWDEPFLVILRRHMGARSIDIPAPTIATAGHIGIAQAFMLSQASGGAPRPVDRPMPTTTTTARPALIAPYYGSGSGLTCTTDRRPLPTLTAKARVALAMPVTHGGSGNRCRSMEQPLPTITTASRGELALVTGIEEHADYDILFRMLEPHELAAAMGFPPGYPFAGNKTETIRQIGNAVPRGMIAAQICAMFADDVAEYRLQAA